MKFSFVVKLALMAGALLLSLIGIGALGTWNARSLSHRLGDIGEVQLPAVRHMTLLALHQDGIKSVALDALVQSDARSEKTTEELRKSFASHKDSLRDNFNSIEKLKLPKAALEMIGTLRDPIQVYLKNGESVFEPSVSGAPDTARKNIAAFEESFKTLQSDLADLSEAIELGARENASAAVKASHKAETTEMFALLGGSLFAALLAAYMIWDLRRILKMRLLTLTNEAERLQESSKSVQTSSQQLSATTSQQSAAIVETASTMEEMNAMLGQTSQNAALNLENVGHGQGQAEKGHAVIARLSSAMDEIQASNVKLDGLVKLINGIKEKTSVINEIVAETRLLSFNASIEAARAGAHGKGFAVVAEEVGKLASMSGKAAGEIRGLLESSAEEVTNVVKDTLKRVEGGRSASEDCAHLFNSLKTGLEKIAKSTEMISSAAQEQEQRIKETNRAMSHMSQGTHLNAQSVEVLSHQSGSLSDGAISLHQTIEHLRFTLLGGKDAGSSQRGSLVQTKISDPTRSKSIWSRTG
jgi:methyl-accepting chemotaxis protein